MLRTVMSCSRNSAAKGEGVLVDDGWKVAGNQYSVVNANETHLSVFQQWGVVRSLGDGTFYCQSCSSKQRHCYHTAALLDDEGVGYVASRDRAADVERKIKQALSEIDGTLVPGSISRDKIPFFPDDDPAVWDRYKGGHDES